MSRYQRGHIYEAFGAFHVRFYQTELRDGQLARVQKSHRLCAKDRKHYSEKSKPVRLLCDEFMRGVNTATLTEQDMTIGQFWQERYLPYCEQIVKLTGEPRKKASTIRGYMQIWRQHLETHFGKLTLQEYEPHLGTRFLQSLSGTQAKNTIKHVRACASSLFRRAVVEQRIKTNPWRDVQMPDDAIESSETQHYTLEEAENIISALVDHVDCQLVIALSCFLGLRPGEIAALRWEDFDTESVNVRRSVVRGNVGTPKTPESIAPLPLIDQVVVPLELWRRKSQSPKEGWVFPSRNDTPVDLHNLIARIIVPHVEGKSTCVPCKRVPKRSGVEWKGLYAGRRGACTAVVEATGGNYAVAQALLRHKSMKTTLDVYKKRITPQAFKNGMKLLEEAANKR